MNIDKTKKTFSSTLAINTNQNYIYAKDGVVSKIKNPSFSKEQFVISTLDIKNTISTNISISKNIDEEDIYDAIATKAYDELGLDQALEYHIDFIEIFTKEDEENRNFHLFIVDPSVIEQTYKDVQKQIKYIDIIIPSPLLLKTLYTNNIIEDTKTHCFIYFQNTDAFIAIYDEANFVYTKSLKYSFNQLHERFCELYGERVEFKDFMTFFKKENLKDTNSDYKEYFIKLYKEIFLNINDFLTYIKRAYDLESIDKIYIGCEVDTVMKLDEILEYQLNIKTYNFDFEYGFEKSENYIDQLQYLMLLYPDIDDEDKYLCNFTMFERPPQFLKRKSGQIIVLTLASIILAFIYPASYWVLTYANNLQYKLLNKNYKEIHSIRSVREVAINNKKQEKEKALKLLNTEKQKYIDKKNTLIKIHKVKVNYPMKAKLLTILTKDLNKFNVKVNAISYEQQEDAKNFYFNLISKKDKQITSLIKYLTKEHLNMFDFSIENIYYDEIDKRYISRLKVVVL
ncbi:MAG: hypothetical protein ABGW74_02840 [Campylobacterales bacterium]